MIAALLISAALAGEFCDELRQKPRAYREALGPVVALGASVSAGYGGVKGPARRLADILDVPYISHAVSGAPSGASLGRWKQSDESCGTVVGVDLFFWDTVRRCNPNSVKELLRQVSAHKCKRGIFSHVPHLVTLQKASCIKSINRELDNGVSIDVLAVMDELRRDSNRSKYFQADRIHLTDAGAEAATEKLCELLL
jgi:hypothetical protein